MAAELATIASACATPAESAATAAVASTRRCISARSSRRNSEDARETVFALTPSCSATLLPVAPGRKVAS